MNLRYHLAHEPQRVRYEEHLLLNIHDYHPLIKFNHELNCLHDIVKLEEILFLFEVEEDFANDYSQREVEHLIVELFHVESEVLGKHSLQELD